MRAERGSFCANGHLGDPSRLTRVILEGSAALFVELLNAPIAPVYWQMCLYYLQLLFSEMSSLERG